MATDRDQKDYRDLARRELDMAASTTDVSIKAMHLDRAAEYATLAERSMAPCEAPPKVRV